MSGATESLLAALLPLSVEKHVRRWAGATYDRRAARFAELGSVKVVSRGEQSVYDGFSEALIHRCNPGESAAEFNRLAELLAIAAFQPGGIKFSAMLFTVIGETDLCVKTVEGERK